MKAGAVVVDNSSAFRMDPQVPLVVPEINPQKIKEHKGIIANPNCSTIIGIVPVWPLHKVNPVKRMVVSTYQAASGAGCRDAGAGKQSREILAGKPPTKNVFPHQIAFNCFSHNSALGPNGYNEEETKMVNETRKIFHCPEIAITATCVRVPVMRAHCESINLEFTKPITPDAGPRDPQEGAGRHGPRRPRAQPLPDADRRHRQGRRLRRAHPPGRVSAEQSRNQPLGLRRPVAQGCGPERDPDRRAVVGGMRLTQILASLICTFGAAQRMILSGSLLFACLRMILGMALRNVKLTIAYDGSDYHGWQMQPGCRTVQEVLTEALRSLLGPRARICGASRTDAGVSALGQVGLIQIDSPIPTENLAKAITDRLPEDMAIVKAEEVPMGFDVIGDVTSKQYRYTIFSGPVRPVLHVQALLVCACRA